MHFEIYLTTVMYAEWLPNGEVGWTYTMPLCELISRPRWTCQALVQAKECSYAPLDLQR